MFIFGPTGLVYVLLTGKVSRAASVSSGMERVSCVAGVSSRSETLACVSGFSSGRERVVCAASVSSGRERISCVPDVFKRSGKGRVRGRRFNWKGRVA